jgi:hypothetical protein
MGLGNKFVVGTLNNSINWASFLAETTVTAKAKRAKVS